MSHVRTKDHIKLIFVADLHLSSTAPIARSKEPCWFEAMKRPLRQLQALADDSGAPIVCAGDVFDRWNPSPELLNFALDELPFMYSIPGQHDLPYHRYDDIRRSGYWTLVKAGKIHHLPDTNVVHPNPTISLQGFRFGGELRPNIEKSPLVLDVAVVHQYLWKEGKSYANPNPEHHYRKTRMLLEGFDIAVFGDNHIPFSVPLARGTTILNCGSLMRRTIDQINYRPRIWYITHTDACHQLQTETVDIEKDIIEVGDKTKVDPNIEKFVRDLKHHKLTSYDFRSQVIEYIEKNKVSPRVSKIIYSLMEEVANAYVVG